MNPTYFDAARRCFLTRTGLSLGSAALVVLGGQSVRGGAISPSPSDRSADHSRGVVQPLHHRQRVKRVIHLCMAGGPSHLETLDYKPKLAELHGQPMPESFTKGQQIAQLQGKELRCLGPQIEFNQCGQSGQMISAAFPHLQEIADEICIVRSLQTEQINHDPAHTFMNTGSGIPGRPSMGSWVLYGLGSDCEDLPGFVVLVSVGGGQDQPIASRQWHSGFLPSRFQGVQFQSAGDPVLYVGNPAGISTAAQRAFLDSLGQLNRLGGQHGSDPELQTRISQYEMAFRMQTSVPDLMDISGEPDHVLSQYGVDHLKGTRGGDGSFASNCLLARRMAERGVRFIQLYHRGWDHHGGVGAGVKRTAGMVDRGAAALVRDLKQRGLLEDTLIVWGGEFGRTPMAQGDGRDHHIKGFSMWLAGGGIRPGTTYGATDELGYAAAENKVHVHDLHATMLHLLGIDHLRFTVPFQGREYRLTDIHGKVVTDILG